MRTTIRRLCSKITKFVDEYNDVPTKEVLTIEVEKRKDINEDVYKQIHHLIDHLDGQPVEFDWLVDTTEKWCRDRNVYLALIESIQIVMDRMIKNNLTHTFYSL